VIQNAPCAKHTKIFFSDTLKHQAAAIAVCDRCPFIEACKQETAEFERAKWQVFYVRAGMTPQGRKDAMDWGGGRRADHRRDRQMVELLESGLNAAQVASRFNCVERSVYRARERHRQRLAEAELEGVAA
jgi:hypothetical protein